MENPVDLKPVVYKLIQPGTGDYRLYVSNAVKQIILPVAVQLGKHVVQKKNGRILRHPLYQLDFRQLQGKSRRTLLSL